MNALIILAHGSRRQESNEEVMKLSKEVKTLSDNDYDIIEYAYLELAEPNLLQCIDNVIDEGTSRITVFPYFLNSGNHVTRDIPTIIEAATARYPDCRFDISSFIGMHKDIPKLILELAIEQ
jgi:sirohydrochlorin ferrochelatase